MGYAFSWLREATIRQGLWIFWDKEINNDADYFTKHHPLDHHRTERPKYILRGFNATILHHTFNQRNFWIRVCWNAT
eukprot:9950258-Ditylum_brightwellii.AAC.1